MTSFDLKQDHPTIALFTLAGVATSPGFMDTVREELAVRLSSQGYAVEAASLYPYGDWSRRLVPQLLEIARDLTDIQERVWSSVGARAARERVIQAAEAGRTVLLIGHSGGGITAVQLANQLMKSGYAAPFVIMVGSPKFPIRPAKLRERTLFLSAVGKDGKGKDPVVRLGRWGGWVRGAASQLPIWRRDAHAPGTIAEIPLIGWHPDYFRNYAPYIDEEGISNLEHTLRPLLSWLNRKLPGVSG